MNDKKFISKAIDSYSVLTKLQKRILQSLIKLSVNQEVVVTIEELASLNDATRATVSTAIELLKKLNIITIPDVTGIRFSGCSINTNKIKEITEHYNNRMNCKNN
jgi:predicted transcriptional regulator